MLVERPTLELVLGTKRGPEGPIIVQRSPAEGLGAKLIEVDPALSNCPNKSVQPRSSIEGQERTEEGKRPYWLSCDTTVILSERIKT